MRTRRRSCHPFGSAAGTGNFAVSSHGIFQNGVGHLGRDVPEKDGVQLITGFPQKVRNHFDAMFPQELNALSRYQGIGIPGADKHPADAAFHQRLCTGRLLAMVTAWLQCYINGCAGGILRAVLQGVSFCMQISVMRVPALADDAVVLDNHSTYQRIGIGKADAALCQLYGTLHVKGMLCHENTSENKNCPVMPDSTTGQLTAAAFLCSCISFFLWGKHVIVLRGFSHPDFTVGFGFSPNQPDFLLARRLGHFALHCRF